MLKRKLGVSPLTEITEEFNQGLKTVKDSQAYVYYFQIKQD